MPLNDFRSVHMPYCLKKQPDGTYVVLNREYKPLGFNTHKHVEYENYPIKAKIKITAATAKKLSCHGDTDISSIFLYDDGCIPTSNAANMNNYLDRLKALAKLKVSK